MSTRKCSCAFIKNETPDMNGNGGIWPVIAIAAGHGSARQSDGLVPIGLSLDIKR